MEEIKAHPYFASLDFEKLAQLRIKSPFAQQVQLKSPTDTGYFAHEFTSLPVQINCESLDTVEDYRRVRSSEAQGHFDGFQLTERGL
jgi:hypothetical protein